MYVCTRTQLCIQIEYLRSERRVKLVMLEPCPYFTIWISASQQYSTYWFLELLI